MNKYIFSIFETDSILYFATSLLAIYLLVRYYFVKDPTIQKSFKFRYVLFSMIWVFVLDFCTTANYHLNENVYNIGNVLFVLIFFYSLYLGYMDEKIEGIFDVLAQYVCWYIGYRAIFFFVNCSGLQYVLIVAFIIAVLFAVAYFVDRNEENSGNKSNNSQSSTADGYIVGYTFEDGPEHLKKVSGDYYISRYGVTYEKIGDTFFRINPKDDDE